MLSRGGRREYLMLTRWAFGRRPWSGFRTVAYSLQTGPSVLYSWTLDREQKDWLSLLLYGCYPIIEGHERALNFQECSELKPFLRVFREKRSKFTSASFRSHIHYNYEKYLYKYQRHWVRRAISQLHQHILAEHKEESIHVPFLQHHQHNSRNKQTHATIIVISTRRSPMLSSFELDGSQWAINCLLISLGGNTKQPPTSSPCLGGLLLLPSIIIIIIIIIIHWSNSYFSLAGRSAGLYDCQQERSTT